MPFVSLIIPVYNAEKYLRRCLNSAMEQTFQEAEAEAALARGGDD